MVDDLTKLLKIDYSNSVVENLTKEYTEKETIQKDFSDYCLHVITPRMKGFLPIAEAIDDSNKRPNKTVFCWLKEDTNPIQELCSCHIDNLVFDKTQQESLDQVGKIIERNGGRYFKTLEEVTEYLNNNKK